MRFFTHFEYYFRTRAVPDSSELDMDGMIKKNVAVILDPFQDDIRLWVLVLLVNQLWALHMT